MLLTLLIVTQALAEWVEISQQHYRKPLRTYAYNPFTNTDRIEVEDTTKVWFQNNKSVSEYNWSKAPVKQTNLGSIKQVQHSGFSEENEAVKVKNVKHVNSDEDQFELRPEFETKPTELYDNDKPKATIERVSNVGSIKRVQLHNSPVKSPTINTNSTDDVQLKSKNRYEEFPLNEKEFVEDKRTSETKFNNRRIYVNQIRNRYSTEPTSTFPTGPDEYTLSEEVDVLKNRPKQSLKNRTELRDIFVTKPTFITEREDFIQYEKHGDIFRKDTNIKTTDVTKRKETITTEPINTEKNVVANVKDKVKQSIKQNNQNRNDRNKNVGDLVMERPSNKDGHPELNNNRKDFTENEREKLKKDDKGKGQDLKSKNIINHDESILQNKQTKAEASKGTKPENKPNNMENLLKLMKVVANTISQNTRRSLGGKMRYLQNLKNSLMDNIAERIDQTWPDDDANTAHRRSRSVHATPRGHHVHFPSSESALMTISFLTFAVFLIKLVLQIIQTYKNKTMMVAPVMVAAAGRTALAKHGHGH